MKSQTWKSRWLLMLLISLVPLGLRAQTLSLPFSLTQSNPALTFSIDSNGNFLETGPFNTSTTLTLTNGSQMLWIPAYSAFRAGNWENGSSIGVYSTAFGWNSTASNYMAFAAAEGYATGPLSAAFGESGASGTVSFSANEAGATGLFSMAAGTSLAEGQNSTALSGGTATGNSAMAVGNSALANSYESVVIGPYNAGLSNTLQTPNLNAWVSSDPLFEIGNGTSSSAKSDALVVYKNGNAVFGPPAGTPTPPAGTPTSTVTAPAFVTSTPGGVGDIPMYTGN